MPRKIEIYKDALPAPQEEPIRLRLFETEKDGAVLMIVDARGNALYTVFVFKPEGIYAIWHGPHSGFPFPMDTDGRPLVKSI